MSRFALLIVLSALCSYSNAQKIAAGFLTGNWKMTDSLTNEVKKIQFTKSHAVIFYGEDTTEWKYNAQLKDPVIQLTYILETKKATFSNKGVLLVRNNDCFWWFHPDDYKRYSQALQDRLNITHKADFEAWLKSNRDVFYRVKDR